MIGERIRSARLAAGLTLQQVADGLRRLGMPVTKAALSKHELGRSIPRPDVLLALARVLKVKPAYLLKEPTTRVHWLAFRKNAALSQTAQARVQAWAERVVQQQVWLHRALHPDVAPSFPPSAPCATGDDAETAAEALRAEWGLGETPLESIIETIEDRGGVVVQYPHDNDGFHGLSGWAGDGFPVVVVSANAPDDRKRLTVAHELGHLVTTCKSDDKKTAETLAFRFAAAFIVPRSVVRRELGERRAHLSIPELGILKERYGLSMQAWLRRARDLHVITDSYYSTMCRYMSARGWRVVEPYTFEGRESPTRLVQMTLRALAEGIITPSRAEEILPGITKSPDLVLVRKDGDAPRR